MFDSEEIHTTNVRRNENSPSEQNHFKRITLPTTSLLSTRGMTRHHPINLGQSSQGFNRSFKVQLTWGSPVKISTKSLNCRVTWQVSVTITWGIRMSNLKGYEQSKLPGNITKHPVLGAVLKPLRNSLKRNSSILKKMSPLQQTDSRVYFPNNIRIPQPEVSY